jgi:AcrR family transcriptional regulator
MMRKKTSVQPSDPGVRHRLMTAATDLFNRKGYAAASVREIVEAAGVTKPVLYYHFGSKEGIYLALFKETFAAFMESLTASDACPRSARERLLDLCDRAYTFHAAHLPLVRLMYAIYYGPPQGAPPFDFDATHDVFQHLTAVIIEDGIRSGEIKPMPVPEATWAVIGALNIAMEVDLCHPEQSLGREGMARLLNTVFEGLAAAPAPPKNTVKKRDKGARP